LIDPRSGRPASFEGSLTAVADTGLKAEILSKIFVLGKEGALVEAEKQGFEVMWLSTDAGTGLVEAALSCKFKERVEVADPKVRMVRYCLGRTSIVNGKE
jgi:thiamine biosynthesis lipoprotein ApbE